MESETSSQEYLEEWYRERIGRPATADEVTGYWIFVLGLLLGILGIFLVLTSEAGTQLRGWAIVTSAVGLALLVAGPIVRLPLGDRASALLVVGFVVCLAGVAWFLVAYPSDWRPQASPVIAIYSIGLLVMGFAGVFVPLLGTRDEALAASQAESDQLRGELSASKRESADLRDTLSDTQADEADLAARLRLLRESQSRFELYEDATAEWRWRLRHHNGNTIADSGESYTRKHNAQKGIAGVRRDALGATVMVIEPDGTVSPETEPFEPVAEGESQATFERYEDNAGEHRWRLRHDNGNVLCDSGEGYASRSNLERALERIREYVGPAQYLRIDPTAFEIYEDAAGEWRWRLIHRNGNVLADSGQGYSKFNDASRAVGRLQDNLTDYEFEIYEDNAGEYRWRLRASNDRIVADSGEGYTDRGEVEAAVDRVEQYAPDADALDVTPAAFEIYEDAAGEWRWRLRHRNGNVLADSGQGYDDRPDARAGIESVKRNAPTAENEDV
ncbi:MAG: HVO_2922 family protein [Halorhabdus sp.]